MCQKLSRSTNLSDKIEKWFNLFQNLSFFKVFDKKLSKNTSKLVMKMSFVSNCSCSFEGKILKTGTPEELAQDEMVRKVYLGQNFELRKKKLTL